MRLDGDIVHMDRAINLSRFRRTFDTFKIENGYVSEAMSAQLMDLRHGINIVENEPEFVSLVNQNGIALSCCLSLRTLPVVPRVSHDVGEILQDSGGSLSPR